MKVYSLIKKINNKIYEDFSSKIIEKDQSNALNKAKNKSASGISEISYPLIKKAGQIAQKFFRLLADQCITKGDIPVKQKVEQLYLISKSEDWNYNLANVRPIVLLEVF